MSEHEKTAGEAIKRAEYHTQQANKAAAAALEARDRALAIGRELEDI